MRTNPDDLEIEDDPEEDVPEFVELADETDLPERIIPPEARGI